jgi:hypothetical protein
MNDELFAELVASTREGGAILRGEVAPSRTFVVDTLDTKSTRERRHPSQRHKDPTELVPLKPIKDIFA